MTSAILRYTEEEFNALPVHLQRILIAEDVLLRLKTDKMHASRGVFVASSDLSETDAGETAGNKSVWSFGQKEVNSTPCYVCAKGAIVVSWIGTFNKTKVGDFDFVVSETRGPKGMCLLRDIFGKDLLDAIEYAFEVRGHDVITFEDSHAAHLKELYGSIETTFFGDASWTNAREKVLPSLTREDGTYMLGYISEARSLLKSMQRRNELKESDAKEAIKSVFQHIIDNNGVMKLHNGVVLG